MVRVQPCPLQVWLSYSCHMASLPGQPSRGTLRMLDTMAHRACFGTPSTPPAKRPGAVLLPGCSAAISLQICWQDPKIHSMRCRRTLHWFAESFWRLSRSCKLNR